MSFSPIFSITTPPRKREQQFSIWAVDDANILLSVSTYEKKEPLLKQHTSLSVQMIMIKQLWNMRSPKMCMEHTQTHLYEPSNEGARANLKRKFKL